MENSLHFHRATRRISQMKLAKLTGIPFYRYWKLENGYVEPRDSDRAALAAYFRVADTVLFPDAPTPADTPADDAAAPV